MKRHAMTDLHNTMNTQTEIARWVDRLFGLAGFLFVLMFTFEDGVPSP